MKNGPDQRCVPKQFRHILNKHTSHQKIKTFIETGALDGGQGALASRVFEKVYGIELNPYWANLARRNNPQAAILQGDTLTELPKLFSKYKRTPLFIYLDAHFCLGAPPFPALSSVFPLWKELELVQQRGFNDILLVHATAIGNRKYFHPHQVDILRPASDGERFHLAYTQTILTEFFGPRVKDSEIINNAFVLWLKKGGKWTKKASRLADGCLGDLRTTEFELRKRSHLFKF